MSGPASNFEGALEAAQGAEGWLSDAQARRLWERAGALDASGRAVEIGSYRGRSAIVLARALPAGAELTAIDPHAGNDRGPQQLRGEPEEGEADLQAFRANLARAGVAERVHHLRLRSQDALHEVSGSLALVYVDGAHRYRPARSDIAGWGSRLGPGGTLLIHDAFSSIGVTLAIGRLLLLGDAFRYQGRTGSLAEYRRVDLSGAGRCRNAASQLAELPWFGRNLLVKAALVAGLRGVARALGHRSGPWPY